MVKVVNRQIWLHFQVFSLNTSKAVYLRFHASISFSSKMSYTNACYRICLYRAAEASRPSALYIQSKIASIQRALR